MENIKIKKNEIKKFGFLISLMMLILYLYCDYKYKYKYLLLIISILILSITIYKPDKLNYFYNKWLQFGWLLKKITNPFVMLLIYMFISILGSIFRMYGRDILYLRKEKYTTMWIKINKKFEIESFKDQY